MTLDYTPNYKSANRALMNPRIAQPFSAESRSPETLPSGLQRFCRSDLGELCSGVLWLRPAHAALDAKKRLEILWQGGIIPQTYELPR